MDFRFDAVAAFAIILSFAAILILLRFAGWGVSWLKFVVFLILVWFVLEPSVAVAPAANSKPSLAVLVDVSKSMGIEDPRSRLDEAQKLLDHIRNSLEDRFKVTYYQFSESASRLSFENLLIAKPQGDKTDIDQAIDQVLYESKRDKPALLILSDGTKTAGRKEEDSASWTSPIFSVGIGNAAGLNDIAILETHISDFAFKGRPVELSVTVRNYGFAQKRLPVILKEIGEKSEEEIQVREVRFGSSIGESNVSFKFTPGSVGRLKYRVAIPVQKNEIAKLNNTVDFSLEVGREKLRILYLCGQPSPEYYFLRQVLKSDPSIDLVSFVILRNPENVVPVSEDQLSLIPFPANDIFVRTLSEFDLLIFENFSYARFGIQPYHLENIKRFVEDKGGGFLMIGGENSFGRGNYADSAIDSILPVQMDVTREEIEDVPVSLKIVDEDHPIFALGDSAAENKKIWQSLPLLDGYYRLPGIKSGASLLASSKENGAPLIVGWRRGKGRVMAMGIFSTWQWALGLSEKGFLQSNYTQFWRQTVRWLTSLEDSKEVRMILNQTQCATGKPLSIQVFVRQGQGGSAGDRSVTVTVSQEGKASESILLNPVNRNEFRGEWVPSREGRYELLALLKEGLKTFSDKRVVSVQGADQELENPYPNHDYLKSVSHKSGGEFFMASEFSPEKLEGKIRASLTVGVEPVRKNLSSSPWLLVIAAGLLMCEWAVRRYNNQL